MLILEPGVIRECLETRGAIGVHNKATDTLELYGAAKIPHRNRDTLVRMLSVHPREFICMRDIQGVVWNKGGFIQKTFWYWLQQRGLGALSNG